MNTENKLATNFNFLSLIKFAFPSIIMMMFSALYIVVDGAFVSRLVHTNALSAINIIYPLYSFIFAIATMLSCGSSALIAKKMGEQKNDEAKSNFSLITIVSAIIGIVFAILCLIFLKPLIYFLGSNDNIYHYCYDYIIPILIFAPFCILQILFQSFYIVAGKPKIGLILSIIGGTANIILDYVFIVPFDMGIAGASYGTVIGFFIQSIFGIFYFLLNRKGTIYFTVPKYDFAVITKSCYIGLARLIENTAIAITTFLFNIQMMKYGGVDGIAAITIVLYIEFILVSVFIGYSGGIAPIFSYNYGAKNTFQLKKVFKITIYFISIISVLVYICSFFSAPYLIYTFAVKESVVFKLGLSGFMLFSISFFFTGTNIFSASLFIALSNGKIATVISILRTLIFLSVCIMLLPVFLGINGVWLSVPVTEFLSFIVSWYYLITKKNNYGYI